MLEDMLKKIEDKVSNAPKASEETKQELLRLLGELKHELQSLPDAHAEDAQSIAGFTQVAAHEATREKAKPDLTKHALDGLSSSVGEFEASHPKLTSAVREFCTLLSNSGI